MVISHCLSHPGVNFPAALVDDFGISMFLLKRSASSMIATENKAADWHGRRSGRRASLEKSCYH